MQRGDAHQKKVGLFGTAPKETAVTLPASGCRKKIWNFPERYAVVADRQHKQNFENQNLYKIPNFIDPRFGGIGC